MWVAVTESQQEQREKLRAVWLSALLVFSVFAPMVFAASPVAGNTISVGNTESGNAPMADVPDAEIDPSSDSDIPVSYNVENTGLTGGELGLRLINDSSPGDEIVAQTMGLDGAKGTGVTLTVPADTIGATSQVKLTVIDGSNPEDPQPIAGASDTATITVSAGNTPSNTNPTASLSVTPSEFTAGDTLTFDASGSTDPDGTIETYIWDFDGDGQSDKTTTSATTTATVDKTGTFEPSVTVFDNDNGGDFATAEVTGSAPGAPSAALSASPTDPAVDETVTFDASGSTDSEGSVEQYEWDFDGDGTYEQTTSSATVTHAYDSVDFYTATVRVTDNDGYTDTETVDITVGDAGDPVAWFYTQPSSSQFPSAYAAVSESVTFDATNSFDRDGSITKYEWDFDGDGTYDATGSSVTHTYSSADVYDAKLQITDDNGNTATRSLNVFVGASPAVLSSDISYAGSGTQPTMSDITVDAFFSSDLLQVQVINDTAEGFDDRYELEGVGVDETTELTISVTMDDYVPRSLIGSGHDVTWTRTNNGDGTWTVTITGTPAELQYYFTEEGGTPTEWGDKEGEYYTASNARNQSMTFAVTDLDVFETQRKHRLNSSTFITDAQSFGQPKYDTSGPTDSVKLSLGAPHYNADGTLNTGFFEAYLPPAMLDHWGVEASALSGSFQGATRQSTITSTKDGGARIDFSVHYSEGDAAITVDNTAPTADAGSAQTVGVGETVAFDGTASSDNTEIESYEWDFDGDGSYDATGATPTHAFSSPGTYTVTLRVTDAAGNTDTATVTITVEDTTAPTAEAGSDQTVKVDETVSFDGTGSTDNVGVNSYEWDFDGDGTYDATGSSVTHSFGSSGTETVTLRVTDAAGNTDTDTLTVTVEQKSGSGDGDGPAVVNPSQSTDDTDDTVTPTPTETPTPTDDTETNTTAEPTNTTDEVVTETDDATANTTEDVGDSEPEPTATPEPTPEPTDSDDDSSSSESSDDEGGDSGGQTAAEPTTTADGPGFGAVVALLGLVSGALLARRRPSQ